MRFKASIRNINTFTRLTASLSSLGKDVWLQLNNDQLRFTVVPEQGSQVWAVLAIDSIFETYTIQSAVENNTINLRIPLAPLHRALRSALTASSASIRLTKKDNIPLLSLTIITNNLPSTRPPTSITTTTLNPDNVPFAAESAHTNVDSYGDPNAGIFPHDRETTITQEVPVIVLAAATVASIHEPQCPQPDVHIMLPSLLQLKAISERFTKLALSTSTSASNRVRLSDAPSSQSRLILSANAHGVLRIGVETPSLKIESKWEGLTNPELDPEQVEGGEEGVRGHASTRMKEREGDEAWSVVRVEGRDWGRVLGVGRLGGRVIACFCHEHALILYVYLSSDDTESVLTYYIASYSA
ncbi:cell cycle checkpoint protein-like protein [Usnea florida]